MDRDVMEHRLREAEKHMAQGAELLARQRRIVEQLERDGREAETARTVLRALENSQFMHKADRDRLFAELATLS